MHKQHVVIVGGGFGGLKAALELCHDPHFAVTLISDEDYFRYYPALYHTATGGPRQISAISLKELVADYPIELIKARAEHLDRHKQEILTKGAGKIKYDQLILALGMTTNYFGIKGLEEFSYGIKSIAEVDRLKAHLHQQLQNDHRPDLHYLVVGAGPTGVELAGVLPDYLRRIAANHDVRHRAIHVELVEAAPRILPRSSKHLARATARQLRRLGVKIHTNQKVEAETAEALVVNGQPIASKTVIWTAGVACHSFFANNGFAMTEHHKVQVNEQLQAEPNIYVLGDNADTVYSGVAQTALYDAVFVAGNLRRQVRDQEPKKYRPKKPVYVTPTGKNWASVAWGKLEFSGRLGWAVRRLADLVAYRDYEPWWPATERWLAMDDQQESCPICGTKQDALQ